MYLMNFFIQRIAAADTNLHHSPTQKRQRYCLEKVGGDTRSSIFKNLHPIAHILFLTPKPDPFCKKMYIIL
ncbi:hypothetical protein SDJN02_08972, partial [Cucurbita argyrosperma subsp. argyrosperma]